MLQVYFGVNYALNYQEVKSLIFNVRHAHDSIVYVMNYVTVFSLKMFSSEREERRHEEEEERERRIHKPPPPRVYREPKSEWWELGLGTEPDGIHHLVDNIDQ